MCGAIEKFEDTSKKTVVLISKVKVGCSSVL